MLLQSFKNLLLATSLGLGLGSSLLSAGLMATEAPPKKAAVNIQDSTEVIQVLWLASSSELELADLMQKRSQDPDFLDFAGALAEGFTAMRNRFEAVALDKGVGLQSEALTATARLVETNVRRDVEIVAAKPGAEFQSATLNILIYQFQRMISLCEQVEASTSDPLLREAVQSFHKLSHDLLLRARELQTS